MLGSVSRLWWWLFLPVVLSGCNWDLDFGDWNLFSVEALDPVPLRLAVGATTIVAIESEDPDAEVSSTDPAVVTVEKLSASRVRLSAVGVGTTTLTLQTSTRRKDYALEVAQHDRQEVLLVEPAWSGFVPVTEIADTTLLAGVPHRIIVALYHGEDLLFSTGVAHFVLPEASEECDAPIGSFDGHCLILQEGVHVMEVAIGDRIETLQLRAVSEASVANVVLVRDKEEGTAQRGDVIRIDALGLTADSLWVYGIPATVSAFPSNAPFAYTFEPSAPGEAVTVEALDFEREISIHGSLQFLDALTHECSTLSWFGSC